MFACCMINEMIQTKGSSYKFTLNEMNIEVWVLFILHR